MGRRGKGRSGGSSQSFDTTNWDTERTLADAEADKAESGGEAGEGSDTRCPCGSTEFALQAFFHVVDGKMKPDPIEVETLTCPECGREFEPIQAEGGRILRGDFLGWAELDDE